MRTKNKSLVRVISLVLILTLMLGMLTIGASAATRDNVKQYKIYACLGDSIAAGYGPYAKNTTNWFLTAPVPVAYHSLVAQATGAYLLRLGWSGTRTEEMRALLDPEFEGDEWCFQQNGMSWFRNYVDEAKGVYPGWFDDYYVNSVKMADLATLNVGSNDVMTFSFVNVQSALMNAGASDPALEEIAKLVEQNDQNAALKLIYQTAQSLNMVSEVTQTLIESMIHGYHRFFENWRPLIDKIYELNPNITLVVVGLYNPFDNVQMTDQSLIKIGKLGTLLIAGMNAEMKNYAAIKGYKFADVMGTPLCETVPLTDPSFLGRILTDVHPSVEGHIYMTDKILEQLPEREVEPEPTVEPTVVPTEPAEDPTVVPTLPSSVPTEIPDEPVEPTVPVEPTQVDPTEADPTDTEPAKEFPFTDVQKGDWSYDDIYYVWDNGLMKGMDEEQTIFAPQGTTTRAQFATVIYRMAGSPEVTEEDYAKCPFTDLVDDWYKDAVVWAYNAKVVNGVSETTFVPDQEITREQMVAMLCRYSGETGEAGDLSKLTDADTISDYAKPAVAWAVKNGIVTGFPDGTFQPNGNATREQMAAIMARFDRMG